MGKVGYAINGLAVLFITFFNVMFCFPFGLPITVSTMNYNSVIVTGVVTLTAIWWLLHGWRKYSGPKLGSLYNEQQEIGASKF